MAKIEEKDVTIGQWQNKLYQLQSRFDAFKLSQASSLEVFKEFYTRERGDFVKYNQGWKQQIEEINKRLMMLETRFTDKEIHNA